MPTDAFPDLPTPALIVDLDRVDANLERAQAYADRQGVSLRPHAKTHKSPEFARRQLEAGARGICVAKLGEAEVMIDAGIDDVFMANTLFGADKAQRAAALAGGVERAAAHVLATVTSVHEGRAVLDAGSKSLTSDARADGVTATRGFGLLVDHDLVVARLSEEHGVIDDPGAARLRVGQKVRVLPNHICPVVNLFPTLHLLRGGALEGTVPVAARGRLV